ncbi:MAG: sigma-54 dependent transcriptional regulator [Acidobacteriota bacterium]|nr:sigma-54 dependent transcriptional regulator [Acidobacteriota bacterium]MDQ3170978.1 sigma-54 dependent transcriptional regulator [Acidobacteriota bacterium]
MSSTPAAPKTARVLIADDQPDVLEALRLLVKSQGFHLETASSPSGVLAALETREFDVALIDLNYARDTTSGEEGLDLLTRLAAIDPTLPIVVMTAWGSVEVAVEAMRRGARDFVQKPWDNARLLAILRTQIELSQALRHGQRLEAENLLLRGEGPRIIAESPSMQAVLGVVSRVGPSDANVLISGENGTGKGVIAAALHGVSLRASRPMVTVNAGGVSEGVFESELFGHVRGAYTDARADRVGRFELADQGTLFLDEIANVPMAQQAKLLRVIETGEFERLGSSRTKKVDVRIISATNADLPEEVGAGRFRQDLLFRLNTIEIRLPALRERREDIPVLAQHFLRAHAARYRKRLSTFDSSAMQALLEHSWPGNVRELDHAIERAVLMAPGPSVKVTDLGLRSSKEAVGRLEDMSLEDVECFLIKKAMTRFDGNVSQAAKALGLSRSALYRRLQRYGL